MTVMVILIVKIGTVMVLSVIWILYVKELQQVVEMVVQQAMRYVMMV